MLNYSLRLIVVLLLIPGAQLRTLSLISLTTVVGFITILITLIVCLDKVVTANTPL
jgi:hypothetical protein